MTEISVIKIDGKPIAKLIDVISKGVGTLYRPIAIRNEAKAEAYKIEIVERAKSKALAEGKEIEAETYQRIQERILHNETRRQLNIDNIAQIAAIQLEKEDTISDEPVDDDWTTRFFNIVEDISDSEMQVLWGRILAGEVKHPKSFSLRTLELLRNISHEEATILMRVANFALTIQGYQSFLYKGSHKELLDKFNITFHDIIRLTEAGLIQPAGDTVGIIFKPEHKGLEIEYLAGKYIIFVTIIEPTHNHLMPVHLFTKAGMELLKLIDINPPLEYLSEFAKAFNQPKQTFKGIVKYAIINKINEDGLITHSQPLLDFE